MENTELFLSLAEIAGVFVGFGALIAVRTGGSMEVSEVNGIRWVVTTGIWVVIVALAPAIVSTYGLTGHELWPVCSLLALALLAVMIAVFARTPENLAVLADNLATVPAALTALVMVPTFWLPLVLLVLALALTALGLSPGHEQALYLPAVALGLLMGALGLFVAVFWRRRPQTASGPEAMPPPGGSSA